MKKCYVGYMPKTLRPQVFRSSLKPTFATHGEVYSYVVGPFRTERGAQYMATHDRAPLCRGVADAERLALAEVT